MMSLLEVQALSVDFHTRHGVLHALDRIDLTIEAGEILGIVGESGAGKSLTGSAIMRFIEPPGVISGGKIIFGGTEIQSLPDAQMRRLRGKQIAQVFQDPSSTLNPLMMVGDQLIETIRTHLPLSAGEAERRAVQWLEEVGIPAPAERMRAYPFELSGGMRQRVVIALALCCEPELVIADEPTTALDASVQAQILQLFRRIVKDHNTAVMLITHDMGVIAEMADRVAVMYAGRLIEVGPVQEVVQSGRHPYTQGLMASIPDLHRKLDRLPQINGSMPRLNALPKGCRFAPRCPYQMAVCREVQPELLDAGGSCKAACFLVEDAATLVGSEQ
jgi:peptide/nickel transport system ATP-binding protein